MKKRSLFLFALCVQISYVLHAGNSQSLSSDDLHDKQELSEAQKPDQQHLDQPEPRVKQQEIGCAYELSEQQQKDDKVSDLEQSVDAQLVSVQPCTQVQEQESFVCTGTKTVATYSLLQLSALTAGGALVGYGCYKGCELLYNWYSPQRQKEQPMTLSSKDRDILLNFADAMGQDVKQARVAGKRKASVVQKFDISGLSMPLLIECNYIQNDFVKLYHQCDDEGNGIEALNLFYCEFNHALKELIQQAVIV